MGKFYLPPEFVYVMIAAIGGTARYLNIYLNEGTFAWRHFIAHVIVSSFSGYMFYHFAVDIMGAPETYISVIAGMGGWMGVEALKMLEIYLKKKLNKTSKK